MGPVLKVQLPRAHTAATMVESGIDRSDGVLTFHAYSDRMKASVLEQIARGVKFVVTITNEMPKDGEWYEYPITKE